LRPAPVGHYTVMTQALAIPEEAERLRLPFDVASVTTARGAVTDAMTARGASRRVVEDANIVVGELVMNAVRHGRPHPDDAIEVAWWLDDADDTVLHLSVSDGGRVDRLEAQMPSPTAYGGRGLALVAMLCRSWAYDCADGTRVVAAIPAAP
jgi:serine/threonine-protein kinase RsbW